MKHLSPSLSISAICNMQYAKDCELNVIFRSERRLKRLFRFKDMLPQCFQSCVLYRFTCRTCNSSYVGKTARHCHVRWCEHLKTTPITRQPSKSSSESTAVHEHILSSNHHEDYEIIGRVKTLEMTSYYV